MEGEGNPEQSLRRRHPRSRRWHQIEKSSRRNTSATGRRDTYASVSTSQGMLSRSHWLCSRCLGHPLRTVARPLRQGLVRLQSTATTSSDGILSPVLLRRAKSIAEEHARLSAENAENYDLNVAKKIGEMGPVAAALKEWDEAHNVRTF